MLNLLLTLVCQPQKAFFCERLATKLLINWDPDRVFLLNFAKISIPSYFDVINRIIFVDMKWKIYFSVFLMYRCTYERLLLLEVD